MGVHSKEIIKKTLVYHLEVDVDAQDGGNRKISPQFGEDGLVSDRSARRIRLNLGPVWACE
jgi:hypothetical protein